MFPPFFNATSTARVLSLLLHFLKQIFLGPHFQDIAYQPKAASRSAAGKAAKRDSIRGKVLEGRGSGGENFLQKVFSPSFLFVQNHERPPEFQTTFHILTCVQEESVNHSAEAGRV